MPARDLRVVLVGGVGGTNVATGYAAACRRLGLSHELIEYAGLLHWPMVWRLLRRLRSGPMQAWLVPGATKHLMAAGDHDGPTLLLVCGLSKLPDDAVSAARGLGWQSAIYLTDSPWNRELPYEVPLAQVLEYDRIFAPRRSDLARISATHNQRSTYLPFSYDPEQFFPEPIEGEPDFDVVFVGGGDRTRQPIVQAVLDLPIRTQVIGNYWPRLLNGHAAAIGQAPHTVVRAATARAKVNLCLVRRANFDGHVMRSIEIAACGGCILAERTDEHLEILGPEGDSAVYFSDVPEMVGKIQWLLANPDRRVSMARALHARVAATHTYDASLQTILSTMAAP